ncbi:uncharacterized protein LOC131940081 isoform X2 [Physella acuta]|uniref:uncharacterized protein LOC131940081 isoform X2 n=1 Tax=Physella acuta TaxID=109671 RepID=UPI0027DBA573|nr:uncharacterized protein LOC131940081 isoform X2 [Physella acuta]
MNPRRVILVVALFISVNGNEASELQLNSSASIIVPKLKQPLDVICKLEATDPLNLTKVDAKTVTSITISRENDVIASISACGPVKIYSDHQTIRVEGEVSGDHGYLQLYWSTASTKQAGNYTCSLFLETGKQATMLKRLITIESRQTTLEDLIDLFMDMNNRLGISELELRKWSTDKEMASQSSVEKLMNMILNVTKRQDASEKETEKASKEWTLAFRGTAYIGKSVYAAYKNGTGIPSEVEPGCKQVASPLPCNNHYRNSEVFDNWDRVKEVAFVVYSNYTRVGDILFDGQDSTSISWFNKSRVLFTTWKQIKTDFTNFFSIEGNNVPENHRAFFINSNYNGCPGDKGWFVAVDSANSYCPWEKFKSFPVFKYSRQNGPQNWTNGDVAIADMFAVFVKYYSTA